MDRNLREVIAYHEAGHAVLAWACGLDIAEISIVPKGNSNGRIILDFSDEQRRDIADDEPRILRALALTGVGGMAADFCHWGTFSGIDPDETIKGINGDRIQVLNRLAKLGTPGDDMFEFYVGMATHRFKSDRQTWSVATSLAQAVLRTPTLSASQLVAFQAETPKLDEAYWDRFELFRQNWGITA